MDKSKRLVESSLQSKGFVMDEKSHHKFFYRAQNGRKTRIFTMTSHGTSQKTIDISILSKMAKQCWLTNQEFINLVDCPLDQTGYEVILQSKGMI